MLCRSNVAERSTRGACTIRAVNRKSSWLSTQTLFLWQTLTNCFVVTNEFIGICWDVEIYILAELICSCIVDGNCFAGCCEANRLWIHLFVLPISFDCENCHEMAIGEQRKASPNFSLECTNDILLNDPDWRRMNGFETYLHILHLVWRCRTTMNRNDHRMLATWTYTDENGAGDRSWNVRADTGMRKRNFIMNSIDWIWRSAASIPLCFPNWNSTPNMFPVVCRDISYAPRSDMLQWGSRKWLFNFLVSIPDSLRFTLTIAMISLFAEAPQKFLAKCTKCRLTKEFRHKFVTVHVMRPVWMENISQIFCSSVRSISYFWCLTAPRRLVNRRTRVFVFCANNWS